MIGTGNKAQANAAREWLIKNYGKEIYKTPEGKIRFIKGETVPLYKFPEPVIKSKDMSGAIEADAFMELFRSPKVKGQPELLEKLEEFMIENRVEKGFGKFALRRQDVDGYLGSRLAAQNYWSGKVLGKKAIPLDGPVSGGCHRAATGNIAIFVGGERKTFDFTISLPNEKNLISNVFYEADVNGKSYSRAIDKVIYDHMTPQTRFPKSDVSLIKFDINLKANKVGYLMGSGDKVPESLSLVGYDVDLLEKNDINLKKLENYDALIIGVRAFNSDKSLFEIKSKLMDKI